MIHNKRFFIVKQQDDIYNLREIAAEVGYSILLYSPVNTGSVHYNHAEWVFLFMHSADGDLNMVAEQLHATIIHEDKQSSLTDGVQVTCMM